MWFIGRCSKGGDASLPEPSSLIKGLTSLD